MMCITNRNNILRIFLIVLTWKLSTESISSHYLPLNTSLKTTKFPDFGGSPPNAALDVVLSEQTHIIFIPMYMVVKQSISKIGNMYAFLEDMSDVSLHLYGPNHPNSYNYKMSIGSFRIEKCQDENACVQLKSCDIINVNVGKMNETLDNFIFFSWKFKEDVTLILQYNNKLIRCEDNGHPLTVKKIVMASKIRQSVRTGEIIFFSTENKSETYSLLPEFLLAANSLIHLQIMQCLDCKINVELKCLNVYNNITSACGTNGTELVFKNGSIRFGWQDISLPGPASASRCALSCHTEAMGQFDIDKHFWLMAPFLEIGLWNNTPGKDLEISKDVGSESGNRSMTLTITAAVVFLLIAMVGLIFYFIRNRKKNTIRTEQSLITTPPTIHNPRTGRASICAGRGEDSFRGRAASFHTINLQQQGPYFKQ